MRAVNTTITAVPGIRVGHATDLEHVTGCTILLVPPSGARCVVDIRGGAPGTRETALLAEGIERRVNAVLLGGGSAFGLAAADGVMTWLAERAIGFPTVTGPVPIVPAAILYDLAMGTPTPPDAPMGYAACENATDHPIMSGSVGAGTGATVGKLFGREAAMQGGVGSAARRVTVQRRAFTVGALVVVNAVGDIWETATNRVIAGAHDAEGWLALRRDAPAHSIRASLGTNTTLGVVATDAPLPRKLLTRLAVSAHDGLARAIRPAHTIADGDIIFALTTAKEEATIGVADVIALCMAAEQAIEAAIVDAVRSAISRADLPAARDLTQTDAAPEQSGAASASLSCVRYL